MKRRAFIQGCAAGMLTIMGSKPKLIRAAEEDSLESSFKSPPLAARPKVWWHWMNGNVTAEGITLDLEAMRRVGMGGFQLFQVDCGIPQGPVVYGSTEHVQLLEHTAREAERLGLDFEVMSGPGWSTIGGPWISPELSMQQLTWSETFVAGGKNIDLTLGQPYAKRGFYRDAFVVAFPSLPGETRPLSELLSRVTSSNGSVNAEVLTSNDLSKGAEIRSDNSGQSPYLQLEFAEPFEARSLVVYLLPIVGPGVAGWLELPSLAALEASDDGVRFRTIYNRRGPGTAGQNQRWPRIETPTTLSFPSIRAKYFRLVLSRSTRVAGLKMSGATYIADWPQKGNFAHRHASTQFETSEDLLLASLGKLNVESAVEPQSVLDITKYMDSDGRLNWQAPVGHWTILRFGHTSTGVSNHPAPAGATGLECDKFSRTALDFHFQHFFDELLPVMRPFASKGKAAAVIDSYEVGMQNWSPKFPEEFAERRGYDLRKYLPAATGRIIGDTASSNRFLWDFRRTCADLMADNFYGRFVELCHKHGMKACAEPYGAGPFEEIQAGSRLDVPMGEFWAAEPGDYQNSVKLASSIAHVFGKRVVGGESYTGAPQLAKWQNYPYALKGQGDWMFTEGLNELFLSVFAMQPHPTAAPGMTLGPSGCEFQRTNSWFDQGRPWLKYLQRCQFMLQQGLVVADLLYFVGVEVPTDPTISPGVLNPTPPEGYYYDVANEEGIISRLGAANGGTSATGYPNYRVVILPNDRRMTLSLLRNLRNIVEHGVCLFGPKPEFTPGLSTFGDNDAEFRLLADELWGGLDGASMTEKRYGLGYVFWGQPLRTVLEKLDIKPDVEITSRSGDAPINFIHRRLRDADVYFIGNRRRQSEELVCSFRVGNKQPEFWNPENGTITSAIVYDNVDGRVRLPLHLDPAGSIFVVFRSPAPKRHLVNIAKDGETFAGIEPYSAPLRGQFSDITDNFTICVWVMPDIGDFTGMGGRPTNFVIYPPAGAALYGSGHAACGLVAGRDGLTIFEREDGEPSPTLVARLPLPGWTHVTLAYKEGAPFLYVNGSLVLRGKRSHKVVHPGLGGAYQRDGARYFYGEMSSPQLFTEVLSEQRILQLATAGVPPPKAPRALEITNGGGGWLAWQEGRYTFRDNVGRTITKQISEVGLPIDIEGPWHVSFPPNLGAPQEILLPKLMSLHSHPDPGVKYFAGTATYTKRFNFPMSEDFEGKRLFIDLGRVQLIASVRLNRRDLGALWKPPFRADITDVIRRGENFLEVSVTNLLVNRLIGDEQLPPENAYLPHGRQGFGGVTEPGAIVKLPDWYIQGKPKPPGGRISFATWKLFDQNSPLVASGLLGPVHLRIAWQGRIS